MTPYVLDYLESRRLLSGGAFLEQNGQITMDAENYSSVIARGGHSWTLDTSLSGFAGSGAMLASPNTGGNINSGYATTTPELQFKISVASPGTFYLWVRGRAATWNDETLHAGLDGQPLTSATRITLPLLNQWAWTDHTMDGTLATISVPSAGVHTLNIWMREDGLRIDRLVLARSATFAPSGAGPAQSVLLPLSPQDDLPWNIRQITASGQRAAWSPDGTKIAYMDHNFGDAWELDLATGARRELTGGFAHAGFLRVQYLPNGDYLLTGPKTFVNPKTSRFNDAEFWVLKKDDLTHIHELNQKVFEGVAISRLSNTIAWVNDVRQDPTLTNVGAVLYTADIAYLNGVPTLANKREVYRASFGMEAQDFRSADREIICPKYYTNGADVVGINIDTEMVTTYRSIAGEYDEPEGIFPDGKSILVESSRDEVAGTSLSQHLDIWKLDLQQAGSTKFARVTRFGEFAGFKASNAVVSPGGRYIAFQNAGVGQTPGDGNGLFLLDTAAGPNALTTTLVSDGFSTNLWQVNATTNDGSIASATSNGSQVVLSKTADGSAARVALTRTIDTRGFRNISLRLDAFQSATHFEGADLLKIEVDTGYAFVHLLSDAERFDGIDNATADNIATAANASTAPVSTGYIALPRSAANNASVRIRITGIFDAAAEKYLLDFFQITGRRI